MFKFAPTVEQNFETLEEVLSFVSEEKKRLVRIPLKGFWSSGARVFSDGNFGTDSEAFGFNTLGFRALCSLVGVPGEVLR